MLHALSARRFSLIPPLLRFPLNLSRSFSTLSIDFFDHLLRQCTTPQHCKQIHTQLLLSANSHFAFLAARIISVYGRFDHLFDAQKVFDTAPFGCLSNLLLWNSILRANVYHGCYKNAIKLFVKMRKRGVFGDGFTLPLVTRACALSGSFTLCRIVHCHVLEMGFERNLHVGNELVGMYTRLGRMGDAQNVFDRMGVRSLISWNMMVSGYALNYDCDRAVEIVRRMELEGLEPNVVTWTSLISSHARCGRSEEVVELFGLMRMHGIGVNAEAIAVVLSVFADLGHFDSGKVIHGYVVKAGLEDYVFVKNTLICVYGKHGDANAAHNLFLEVESKKSIVTWNALITSVVEAGLLDKALKVFSQLEISELRPNSVSWTALINGFASKGQGEESLELFRQMQIAEVMANAVTIASVLSICAELATGNLGKEIHGHVIRAWMDQNILVANGLVNMYTRCGCLKEGRSVFGKIERKDVISWNSMITGYGMHGFGMNALEIFNQMIKSGTKPNGITFVAVLSACSHAGLVNEGHRLFDQMFREYGIEPQVEHYACMVDLVGRAGLLQEASQIVKNMPTEPNACVWGALLNSCRIHKNAGFAEETASHMFSLDTETTGSYMLLSNIYAASGRWEDSARVRTSARTKGLKKNRGQSWIEVKKNVYTFSAGNNVEKDFEEIYGILEELALQMESETCTLDNSIILRTVDDAGTMRC